MREPLLDGLKIFVGFLVTYHSKRKKSMVLEFHLALRILPHTRPIKRNTISFRLLKGAWLSHHLKYGMDRSLAQLPLES